MSISHLSHSPNTHCDNSIYRRTISLQQYVRVIAFLLFAISVSPYAPAQPADIQGPIAYVGHGGMFTADGKEITPTVEFILDAQNAYINQLLERYPQEKRPDFTTRLSKLRALKLSKTDKVHANAEVIVELISDIASPDTGHIATINAVLHKKYGELMAKRLGRLNPAKKFLPSARLLKTLKRRGFGTGVAALTTNLGGQAYIDQCRAEGVPIPPAWGSPQWQSKGALSKKFIISNLEAVVYTFESTSPRGICIALPRFPLGATSIGTLGIICQGNDTSRACFWDNNGPVPSAGTTPLLSFKGGAALVNGNGVCTDCHAGENPFIVHPGTALDRGAILKPNRWVEPIVAASWPQNPGPSTLLEGIALAAGENSCIGCHNPSGSRFPAVSTELPGYCATILGSAFSSTGTMPPGNAGNATYLKYVNALRAACAQPPGAAPPVTNKPIACGVFDNGYTNMSRLADAVYFAGPETACIPDGTPQGLCRRWFGRCVSTNDNVAVNFKVFDDGDSSVTVASDAVYNRAPNVACIPDGTPTGNCRRWFGMPATTDGRAAGCYLFDDGYTNKIGPTHAIYYRAPGQVCMPDGTANGACRKWFGQCQVK